MKLGRCQPHVARDAVRQLGIEHYVMLNTLMNVALANDTGALRDERARYIMDEVRVAVAIARGLQPPGHLTARFDEVLDEANRWADGKLPEVLPYDGPRSGGRG